MSEDCFVDLLGFKVLPLSHTYSRVNVESGPLVLSLKLNGGKCNKTRTVKCVVNLYYSNQKISGLDT